MNEGEILTNLGFDFSLGGKTYKVKKASLKQVIDWQKRSLELSKNKDIPSDLLSAAYAIYLIIHEVDKSVTEDYVMENVRGDIDPWDMFTKLGFMSQQKVETARKIVNSLTSQPSGQQSSAL